MTTELFSDKQKKAAEKKAADAAAATAATETTTEPVGLGDAAQEALSGVLEGEAVQDPLDDTEFTKIKFVGMAMDDLESAMKIGDQHTFLVHARCVSESKEEMASGGVRDVRKMKVDSVTYANGASKR